MENYNLQRGVYNLKVAIVDYGIGNIHSLRKALELTGLEVILTREEKEFDNCRAIVLPGVGAYPDACGSIEQYDLKNILMKQINKGKYLFGICLGMQLLFETSTEGGETEGLGIFKGQVLRLPDTVKVPHMGWNSLELANPTPLLKGINNGDYVYFVHSYYAVPKEQSIVNAGLNYGVYVPAVVSRENIIATQFHPEKSGDLGIKILNNFREMI